MAPQPFLDKMGITNPFLPLQRRHFFYLVGAATACFGAAIAQQLDRIWRIGILHGVPAEASVGVSAFRQRFGELG